MLEQIHCSGPGGAAEPARGGQSCPRAGAACSIPPNIWMLSTSQLGEHLSEQRSTHWMAVYVTSCWVFTMFNPSTHTANKEMPSLRSRSREKVKGLAQG